MGLDERDAWRESRVGTERRQFLVANGLVIGLHPLWIVFDYYLAPDSVQLFASMRLIDVVLGLIAIPILLRTRRLPVVRWVGGARLVITGAVISYFMVNVDAAFYPYLFGVSLLFWGSGLILIVPVRVSAPILGGILVAQAIILAVGQEHPREAFEYFGGFFFLASASAVAISAAQVRLKTERDAFLANRALGTTNDALTEALDALKDAQLRMVESEKLMALGRLLAGLSHEINNPLTVILNNVEPLQEYRVEMARFIGDSYVLARSSNTPTARALLAEYEELDIDYIRQDSGKALKSIEEAVQRIRSIHGDLRAFIRGKSVRRGPVNLKDGIEVTVRMLERGIPEGVRLVSVLDELPPVNANAGQLNQVILNLLRNALDAVGDQGRVDVRAFPRNGMVEMHVTDDGPGITPENEDRVFEPFFTTKAVGKGTGLGLAISYEIIDQHGGTLELDRMTGMGAHFIVKLPMIEAKTSATTSAA